MCKLMRIKFFVVFCNLFCIFVLFCIGFMFSPCRLNLVQALPFVYAFLFGKIDPIQKQLIAVKKVRVQVKQS